MNAWNNPLIMGWMICTQNAPSTCLTWLPSIPPQSAIDRRANWQKFGDAAHERASDSITSRATEDIPFDRIRPQKQTQEEKGKMDFQTAMAGTDKAAIVGNIKDMLYKRRMERQLMEAQGLLAPAERPPGDDEPSAAPGLRTSGKGWVPPSLRQRLAAGETPEALAMRRRDENSVRVTNLSEDVTEDDLRELFHRFGQIQRCFIPKDRETGESRGFAFVSFARHEDAARAIAKLDGFGYDNLILSVSWAAPREPRP